MFLISILEFYFFWNLSWIKERKIKIDLQDFYLKLFQRFSSLCYVLLCYVQTSSKQLKKSVRFEMKKRHKRSTKEKATQKTKEENEEDPHPAAHTNCNAEFRSFPTASTRTVHRVRARPFHSFPPRTRHIFPVTRSGEVREGDDILRARVLRART